MQSQTKDLQAWDPGKADKLVSRCQEGKTSLPWGDWSFPFYSSLQRLDTYLYLCTASRQAQLTMTQGYFKHKPNAIPCTERRVNSTDGCWVGKSQWGSLLTWNPHLLCQRQRMFLNRGRGSHGGKRKGGDRWSKGLRAQPGSESIRVVLHSRDCWRSQNRPPHPVSLFLCLTTCLSPSLSFSLCVYIHVWVPADVKTGFLGIS